MALVQKQIKKVYLGSTQVRPTLNPSYYDFRNLTIAELTSQGRLQSEYPGIDSNGLYITNTSDNKGAGLYCPVDLSNANKITIKENIYGTSGSWAGGFSIGLAASNTVDSGNRAFADVTFTSYSSSYYHQGINYNGSNKTYITQKLNSGTYNVEVEIDFNTGVFKETVTGTGSFTQSYTFSSSEIAVIKSLGYISCRAFHGTSADHHIQTMEYEIE